MSKLGIFGGKVVQCRVGCRDLSCEALGRSREKGGCPTRNHLEAGSKERNQGSGLSAELGSLSGGFPADLSHISCMYARMYVCMYVCMHAHVMYA